MTKIYLVYAQECNKNGVIKENGKRYVSDVFTNVKKARAYANYFNKRWEKYLEKGGNFEKYHVLWYYVKCKEICNLDYSKMPY